MQPRMLAVLVMLSAACGGSPAGPSSTEAPVLSPGAYRLIVHLAMGTQICDGPFCSSILVCAGGLAPGAPAIVPVSLARIGDEATVRQNDSRSTLVMTLRSSGTSVTGTINGRAYDAGGMLVDIRGLGDEPASLTGGPTGRGTVMGMLNGRVSIGGASCSGEQSTWRLEPSA